MNEFCRACLIPGQMESVLDLGQQPLANGLLDCPIAPCAYYPLELVKCKACGLLQLSHDVDPKEIFNQSYPFFTESAGEAWLQHGYDLAMKLTLRLGLNPHSRVMEVGSNDGSFLANFNCHILGVDPAPEAAARANDRGVPTQCSWFGDWHPDEKQDLIYGTNVLAHTPDLYRFLAAVKWSLAQEGTAVFEFPWADDMVQYGQFDQIYHEHYSYFGVQSLNTALHLHGMHIYHAEYLVTHGGSLRVYIGRRQKVSDTVVKLIQHEQACSPRTLPNFAARAYASKTAFQQFVSERPLQLYAYGAAAKGNTFLNYVGATSRTVGAVGDSSPSKIGKFLPGSRIPIVAEDKLVAWAPFYVLLLPWNWTEALLKKLQPKMPHTKFVTAIPAWREW